MAKYIEAEKIRAEIERLKNHAECSKNEWINEGYNQNAFAEDCRIKSFDKLLSFIDSLQQEQPMPDSTKLIELWHEDKEKLKEKDFRNDPWRLAYNAFLCGFGRGIAVNKQEQPEEECEDLEEAAMNYIAPIENEDGLKVINFSGRDMMDAFKAGAEWQYQKDRAEFAKLKAKTWCEGFDDCKEQMLKNGLEGEVCGRVKDHINVRFPDGLCKYLEPKNISHIPADVKKYEVGDKVRVIIVKEDGGC